MKELPAIIRALQNGPSTPFALATLVSVQGSSYRRPGARLLLDGDGRRVGSISGGCLEEDVMARARRVLATHVAETVIYDTTSENDLVWGVGLGCHGVVRVLIEPLAGLPRWAEVVAENLSTRQSTELAIVHDGAAPRTLGTRLARDASLHPISSAGIFQETVRPPPALYIFGAGDDAQPLARLAKELGWQVAISDVRAAFATTERFSNVDSLLAAPAHELVLRLNPPSDAAAVVMTHHYVHDVPILDALLRRPLAYIGLLGPKKRADKIIADLAAKGLALSDEQRRRLHAPVGLDLGADAPEQVALAIVAEIQASLTGRDARPLRERARPIHA